MNPAGYSECDRSCRLFVRLTQGLGWCFCNWLVYQILSFCKTEFCWRFYNSFIMSSCFCFFLCLWRLVCCLTCTPLNRQKNTGLLKGTDRISNIPLRRRGKSTVKKLNSVLCKGNMEKKRNIVSLLPLKLFCFWEIWFQIELTNKLPYIREPDYKNILWFKANGFNWSGYVCSDLDVHVFWPLFVSSCTIFIVLPCSSLITTHFNRTQNFCVVCSLTSCSDGEEAIVPRAKHVPRLLVPNAVTRCRNRSVFGRHREVRQSNLLPGMKEFSETILILHETCEILKSCHILKWL